MSQVNFLVHGIFAILMLISFNSAHAANGWQFRGAKKWAHPGGQRIAVDYAEKSVGDDTLSIFFDKRAKRWYAQFEYNSTSELHHSTNKPPSLFVRTIRNEEQGRYDSDYVIARNPQTYTNGAKQSQYIIIEFKSEDLAYLKVDLDIGVDYFVKDGCATLIEGDKCIATPAHRTYLFSGKNFSQAISQIERRNGLKPVIARSKGQRTERLKQQKEQQKLAQYIQWFEGNWAEVSRTGPLYGGCDGLREIDYAQFSSLTQKNRLIGGKHKGSLAISALGGTAHDHLYISSGYLQINKVMQGNSLLIPAMGSSTTKKISLFVEQNSGPYVRLRLGEEIPGIEHKRIIETNGKIIRLLPWDTTKGKGKLKVFIRCQ